MSNNNNLAPHPEMLELRGVTSEQLLKLIQAGECEEFEDDYESDVFEYSLHYDDQETPLPIPYEEEEAPGQQPQQRIDPFGNRIPGRISRRRSASAHVHQHRKFWFYKFVCVCFL
jgi:hypothetical protein